MKTYLMQNENYPLDGSLFEVLKSLSINFHVLALPADHNALSSIFTDLEGGVVLLPGTWKDLFSVKTVQEISSLASPFEVVIVDGEPEVANLIVAFNEGLSAYLQTPVTEEKLRQILSRTKSRFDNKSTQFLKEQQTFDSNAGSTPTNHSRSMAVRNQYLGKAFLDIMKRTGPLFDGQFAVLLVTSSSAQQNQLDSLLKTMGISAVKTSSIEEAVQSSETREFDLVISDGILPDGNATALADQLRKTSKRMPHIIVWSSSPENAGALLGPETHIDEVILKPDPDMGIESILPSIISVIYRMH